jgi:hypothetical protein
MAKKSKSKKKRKPKCRNVEIVFMLLHCKGGFIKSKKDKRIQNKKQKEMKESENNE